MAFKGTHNVQSRGSKVWQQSLRVGPKQKVTAGTLLVMNAKSLKPGANTYLGNNTIHAKISGSVEIHNKKISIKPD